MNSKIRQKKRLLILAKLIAITFSTPLPMGLNTGISGTALQAVGTDQFISIAMSLNKYIAVTDSGRVYSRHIGSTTAPMKYYEVKKQLTVSEPVVNFHGTVDCWQDKDTCLVCGIGGCQVLQWTGNSMNEEIAEGEFFFHKSFSYKSQMNYVFQVVTLIKTTYFVALEGMRGDSSAGLIRYDINTNNCHKNWSPKLTAIDGSPPEYYLEEFGFSNKVMALNVATRHLVLLDYSSMVNPIKTETLPLNEAIGPISAFSYDPRLTYFVSCQRSSTHICSLFEIKSTQIMTKCRYSQLQGIEAKTPSTISVTFLSLSRYFAVGYGSSILIYLKQDAALSTKQTEAFIINLPTPILGVRDSFYYKDFLFFSSDKMHFSKFRKNPPTAIGQYSCHIGCGGNDKCNGNFLRSADCSVTSSLCANPGEVKTGFPQGAKCRS